MDDSILNSRKSALLFRLGGLGDLLVAFPSIYLLRKNLSPCSLTLVCREEYGLLLKETGVVDKIVSVDQKKLAPLFTSRPYSQELPLWLSEFSLILGWMQKESSLNVRELCSSLGRKRCHFFIHDPDYPGQVSKSFFENTLEFLAEEGGPNPPFRQCTILPSSSRRKRDGLRLLGEEALKKGVKVAVVHPGSGSRSKCWPLDNFMEIVHLLSHRGYRGALVTGMAEIELEDRLKKIALPNGWVWLQNPPLLKLSGLLSAANFYLGNDSGITHFAAACGTEVIALFRKDLKDAWKPYGNVAVLSGESVSDIKPDSVWETIARNGV